jgi:hypothetical protein
MLRAFGASARIAQAISGQLDVQRVHGARAVGESFRALIDNQVPPSRGLMLSFK